MRAPALVRKIAAALEEAGHETWCVGGAVRDALLGIPHLDWDLATAATPQQVIALFGRRHTVPVGIQHGTVGVRDATGVLHEVTTFRRDVRTDGRHAVVEFGASLDEDLARRDFTINAIAFHPLREELRDPFDGRADIAARMLRAVGDPEARMREDRLRALRAIRFTARFDLRMDEATWRAVRGSAPALTRLSAERVQQELVKTMDQVRAPSAALALWRDGGALRVLVPALADLPDEVARAVDRIGWPDATRRPELAESRRLLRLAVLFSAMPAGEVSPALRALRFSKQRMDWISSLARLWADGAADLAALATGGGEGAPLRRLVARAGRVHFVPLVRLANARWGAHRPAMVPLRGVVHLYRHGVRVAFHEPVALGDLAVDGDDLVRAGLPPGPALGQILRHLLDQVLEDPARNTPDELLSLARRFSGAS